MALRGTARLGCSSLTSINLPDSITSMEGNPFAESGNLTDIRISADHPYLEMIDGVLFSKPDKRLIYYPSAATAKSYVIPDGIQRIEEDAFDSCFSLTSVTIPDSVTTIGRSAFSSCRALTSVAIPDGVTSIDGWTFLDCSSLTSVIIPDSVTSIGDGAFADCDSLTSVTVPDSVTSIGRDAFARCESLILTVGKGSCAEQYCIDNGLNYVTDN